MKIREATESSKIIIQACPHPTPNQSLPDGMTSLLPFVLKLMPTRHGQAPVLKDKFFIILGITGSVLLITFEVSVLHIVLDPLCTSIGSIAFKCEGKDTKLFSNIQIFNVKNDQ